MSRPNLPIFLYREEPAAKTPRGLSAGSGLTEASLDRRHLEE
jgi:hypothetical protein